MISGQITESRARADQLLEQAQSALSRGRLHKASRKGWEAASQMAKAVAEAQGWRYETHDEFTVVLIQAWKVTGNERLLVLKALANDLFRNRDRRKRHLFADEIARELEDMGELVELLTPLTAESA